MPEAHCHPCRARGRTRLATRLVPKTPDSREVIPKCDDCYRLNVPVELTPLEKAQAADAAAFPPAQPVPEVPMQTPHKKPAQIDWPAVQADRDAGELTILQIAEKYGTSTANVYVRTRPRDKSASIRKAIARLPAPQFTKKPRGRPPRAVAVAGLSAEASEFRYVPLDQVPIRRKPAGINAFWLRLAAALVECPAGQAVPFAVPPFAAKAKNPQGSIRGGLTRALRVNLEANGLRFYVACEKGQAWVWPRQGRANVDQPRRAGAEIPSKGKAR